MENQRIARNIAFIKTPMPHPGFLGPDHTARAVIQDEFVNSDPFILLMDDILDKKGNDPVGGPHPHAGFETVSLLLEGKIGDSAHMMKAGDFQIMTAGSGIIHTESIEEKSRMRLLQMWLNLPKTERWAKPRVQDLTFDKAPLLTDNGVVIRLYSGSFAGLVSPVQNYVPLIVADIELTPGKSSTNALMNSYNTFLYVIDGTVEVGDDGQTLTVNQIGWLNKPSDGGEGDLTLKAGDSGARVIMYAGVPQNDPIVPYGPFIADRPEEIKDLYSSFRHGEMLHVSTLPEEQRISY